MSEPDLDPNLVSRMRAGFVGAPPRQGREDVPDPERLLAIAGGEAEPDEVAALADRLAGDPELALEWTLARMTAAELADDPSTPRLVEPTPAARQRWFAASALTGILVAAAAVLLWVRSGTPPQADPFEHDAVYRDASEARAWGIADRAVIDRRDPVVQWNAIDNVRTYRLRVLTEDLEVVHELDELDEPRARLPDEIVDRLGGATFRFTLQAKMMDGSVRSSPTFHGTFDP